MSRSASAPSGSRRSVAASTNVWRAARAACSASRHTRLRLSQPFLRDIELAGAGRSDQMRLAKCFVRRRIAPFVRGITFGLRVRRERRLQDRAFASQVHLGVRRSPPAAGPWRRHVRQSRYRRAPAWTRRRPARRSESGRPARPTPPHRPDHARRKPRRSRYPRSMSAETTRVRLPDAASRPMSASCRGRGSAWVSTIPGFQLPIRRDPGIEQPGRLQSGLQPGTRTRIDMIVELDQLPERRSCPIGPSAGRPRMRGRRDRIFAGFETQAFVFQTLRLLKQGLKLGLQFRLTGRQTPAGLLLRRRRAQARRIVASRTHHPVRQRRKHVIRDQPEAAATPAKWVLQASTWASPSRSTSASA